MDLKHITFYQRTVSCAWKHDINITFKNAMFLKMLWFSQYIMNVNKMSVKHRYNILLSTASL